MEIEQEAQSKKRADPFKTNFKAGRLSGGVRITDDARPAGIIKLRSKAAGGGGLQEERIDTREDTGIIQDSFAEGDNIRQKNTESDSVVEELVEVVGDLLPDNIG